MASKKHPTATLSASELSDIESLIFNNQLDRAALRLNALQVLHPKDARVFLLGSLLGERAGNAPAALAAARRAFELAPSSCITAMRAAEMFSLERQHEDGLRMAQIAVMLGQDAPSADLFSRAAGVAAAAFHTHLEAQWLKQALTLSPGQPGLQLRLAHACAHNRDFAQAVSLYDELLKRHDAPMGVRLDRCMALLQLGRKGEALVDARILVEHEPENAEYRYYHALSSGTDPGRQPASLLAGFFDRWAPQFNRNLLEDLHYNLPQRAAQRIREWYPDAKLDLMDLGCGTGLLGRELGNFQGALVGVDFSRGMLEEAAKLGLYHKLYQVDLGDALRDTPAGHYDVMAALDVLNYVGGLEDVLPGTYRILTPGGRLIFSCETAHDSDADCVFNNSTERFAHNPSAVERQLVAAGFENIEFDHSAIRMEQGQAVDSFVVTARKPA